MTQNRIDSPPKYTSEIITSVSSSSAHWTKRLAIALGGFLILVGVVMILTFSLLGLGIIDVDIFNRIFAEESNQQLFLYFLFVIGMLDIVAGVILRRE